ncbi:MAG: LptA/OstA family protein [Candidatus Ancaeobacter aquaticus]|nr:LptA/OstA family protein [Candidatus Ancaeobacter aquaticus]
MGIKRILFGCLCLICMSIGVHSVFGEELPHERFENPTVITSDGGVVFDYTKNIAIFTDNVVVKDDQGVLKADKMKVFFDAKGSSMKRIEAFGHVFIDQGGRQAESQKLLMLVPSGKIILTGNPRIKQGVDTYSAQKITILKKSNRIIFEPKAKLMIFQQKKDQIF